MCIIKNIEKKHETMKNVAANVLLKKHSLRHFYILSATWQKGESKNGGNKKTQHTKFSKKKQILLTPCFHIRSPLGFPFYIITNN